MVECLSYLYICNRFQQANPHLLLGEGFPSRFVLLPSVELYCVSVYDILIIFCRWGNPGHWDWWLPYSPAPSSPPSSVRFAQNIQREINVWVIHHSAPLTVYLAHGSEFGEVLHPFWELFVEVFPIIKMLKRPSFEIEKLWDKYRTSNILSLFFSAFRMIPYPLEKGHLFYPYPICTETADRELLPCKSHVSLFLPPASEVVRLSGGVERGGNDKCL